MGRSLIPYLFDTQDPRLSLPDAVTDRSLYKTEPGGSSKDAQRMEIVDLWRGIGGFPLVIYPEKDLTGWSKP